MSNRFGFWTLLIASALWAQGCAHTRVGPNSSSLSDIHKKLQGSWKCHLTINDPPIFVTADSVLVIGKDQMLEKGLGKFEIRAPNQRGHTRSEVEIEQTYVLIDNQHYSYIPTAFHSKIIESSNNTVGNTLIQIEQGVNKKTLQKIRDKTQKTERFLFTDDNSLILFGTESNPPHEPQTCTRIQKQ